MRHGRALGLFMVLAIAGCTGTPGPSGDDAASADDPATPAPARCAEATTFRAENITVTVKTDQGDFDITLLGEAAPITVCNFLRYVEEDFYDGTTIHRICKDFVIQAGGVEANGTQRPMHEPIENEAVDNGLRNDERTVAMGRELEPETATSHFYVNLVDNEHLNPGGYDEWGFAVFGIVSDGYDVVLQIADTPVVPSAAGCDGQPLPGFEVTITDVVV